ncbi:unnamed protein product [Nyctereutes procyonoides]|uniref:(raccoon dog) hypothetical protein n=1 Tax=Nyctereutes procyonoides TaxID=34880 RepID=A0A811Y5J3_NYCPR|nr:unnamed protein product [Nyctereutes procyonoides]
MTLFKRRCPYLQLGRIHSSQNLDSTFQFIIPSVTSPTVRALLYAKTPSIMGLRTRSGEQVRGAAGRATGCASPGGGGSAGKAPRRQVWAPLTAEEGAALRPFPSPTGQRVWPRRTELLRPPLSGRQRRAGRAGRAGRARYQPAPRRRRPHPHPPPPRSRGPERPAADSAALRLRAALPAGPENHLLPLPGEDGGRLTSLRRRAPPAAIGRRAGTPPRRLSHPVSITSIAFGQSTSLCEIPTFCETLAGLPWTKKIEDRDLDF